METQAFYPSSYSVHIVVTVIPYITSRSGEPAYVTTIALALGFQQIPTFLADSDPTFLHAFLSTGEDTVLRRVLTCWLQGLIA